MTTYPITPTRRDHRLNEMSHGRTLPRVAMVARTDTRTTGLARYVYSLYDQFDLDQQVYLATPEGPPLLTKFYPWVKQRGPDLQTFFRNYPTRARIGSADICHITSQNLATLLHLQRLPPTIVTVHDLYHLIERQNVRRPFQLEQVTDWVAAKGLQRADEIIAISVYTKQTIIDLLHYPADRITVIHRAVDNAVFKPMGVPPAFRHTYGLPENAPLVLYVGSEDPRKNLHTLIEAFRHVHARCPEAVLVKAGAVHFGDEAKRLRQRVQALGLEAHVVFIERLPDDDLPLLYNTADIFVIPSLFEGFGLPALEGMACGSAVVAANATSLPEVVGDAGLLVDPQHTEDMARAIIGLLEQPERRRTLGEQALARSQTFSLEHQAQQTVEVYRRLHQRTQTKSAHH